MKHIFSSGEVLYSKNSKELDRGTLLAETLHYDEISEDTVFEAHGCIGNSPVAVRFKLHRDCFDEIKFKSTIKILMQSDIMEADWEYYEIEDL